MGTLLECAFKDALAKYKKRLEVPKELSAEEKRMKFLNECPEPILISWGQWFKLIKPFRAYKNEKYSEDLHSSSIGMITSIEILTELLEDTVINRKGNAWLEEYRVDKPNDAIPYRIDIVSSSGTRFSKVSITEVCTLVRRSNKKLSKREKALVDEFLGNKSQ